MSMTEYISVSAASVLKQAVDRMTFASELACIVYASCKTQTTDPEDVSMPVTALKSSASQELVCKARK